MRKEIFPAIPVIVAVIFALVAALATTASRAGDNHGGFIYASGTDLMLRGKPFRYVGANTYYLMVYAATPDLKKHVDEIFDEAGAMNIKVMRTWAFNDGARQWNALQKAPGVYNEKVFAGLDYVVAKAKEKGIYLILSFGNNWDHYGGVRQYLNWSPSAVRKEHNEFFTDATAKQYYKNHIRSVLTRKNTLTGVEYRNDPTILAWELMNEPRVENDFSGDILTDWIAEMSAYAKTLDKNHLVMTGCEGFYADRTKYDWKLNGAKGGDFIRNHAVKTVDIASCHIWPGSSDYCLTAEGVVEWLKLHIEDARKLGKPLILGEYGEIRGFNGDTVERDRLFSLVLDLAEKEGMAGTNFWVLLHNDYRQYDDGYGVYYPEDKSTVRIIKAAAKKSKRGGSAGWKFPPLFFR